MTSEAIEKIVEEISDMFYLRWHKHIPLEPLRMVASRVLEEAAQQCEKMFDECARTSGGRPNCHSLDAQKIRGLSGVAQEEKA